MTTEVEVTCTRCHQKITHSCATPELRSALRSLANFKPESMPFLAQWKNQGRYSFYTPGDETAPFFSEAFLYNLFQFKDDARALLGIVSRVCEAAGIDFDDLVDES